MGQSASPIINKLGLTMFWGGMWDDKINFSRKLKEDILINMFLFLIFTGCVYRYNLFAAFNKDYFFKTFFLLKKLPQEMYYNQYITIEGKGDLKFLKSIKIKNKIHYIGKIWLLRFQNWLVISFHLYIPVKIKNDGDEEFDIQYSTKRINRKYVLTFFKKNQAYQSDRNTNMKQLFLFFDWYHYNCIKLTLKKSQICSSNQHNLLTSFY